MDKIFDLVYRSLKWLSEIFGVTYEEINVIIWFIMLPVIFAYLLDRVLKTNYVKIALAVMVVLTLLWIPSFENFSKLLFQKSAAFLHWFNYLGLNYTQASVLICLVLPIIVIFVLYYLKIKAYESKRK